MRKSFTLVELLVVMGVLAVLVVTILVSLNPAEAGKKSRDLKRKKDLSTLQSALEAYSADRGSYPSTGGEWSSYCNWWTGNKGISGDNGWIPYLAPDYIKVLPLDPRRSTNRGEMGNPNGPAEESRGKFCYIYRSDGADYKIAAHCAVESETVTSGHPYYKGHEGSWYCPNNAYALYTDGARDW